MGAVSILRRRFVLVGRSADTGLNSPLSAESATGIRCLMGRGARLKVVSCSADKGLKDSVFYVGRTVAVKLGQGFAVLRFFLSWARL